MPVNSKKFASLVRERILILDGAMGSMLKEQKLADMLCLEKPALIVSIHNAYLEAGADIISSCSFNANAISLADYGLADKAYEISRAAAALAREAADKFSTAEKKRFAAGSMGPTSKSASICQDLNDPGKRSVSWDELEAAYYDNARGLLDGGADLLLLETIFDTLNAKAAIAAVMRLREERNADIPLMISATVANDAGRLLSGQSLEAFAVSVSHAEPFSIGLNCSFGAERLFPHLAALSAFTPFSVSCYPNAGLPDQSGAYREGPEQTALFMKKFFEQGIVNIAGGCCGTTPAHIAALAELAKNYKPRPLREKPAQNFFAGLEAFALSGAVNAAYDQRLSGFIKNNLPEDAANLLNDLIDDGAEFIKICLDDDLSREQIVCFLNNILFDPSIARVPIFFECSSRELLVAALKCVQGKSLVSSSCFKKEDSEFLRQFIRRYGAVKE